MSSTPPTIAPVREAPVMPPGARIRSLTAIMVCIGAAAAGLGLLSPLLGLLMNEAGVSGTVIGLNTATGALAILLFSFLVPRLMRLFGVIPLLCAFLVIGVATTLAFKLFENVWLWFPLRFVFNCAFAGIFVVTEVWINTLADERARGRLLGIYATVLAGGFVIGVGVLALTGTAGWQPFLIAAGIILLALAPVTMAGRFAPDFRESGDARAQPPALGYVWIAPAIMGAGLLFGAVETGIFNLLPVYGVRLDLTAETAAVMLLVVSLGNMALQYPIGWIADLFDRRMVLLGCALTGLVSAALIPLLIGNPWLLYPLLFIMGGVVVGLYTVGLILLGQRFRGHELAGANAAFIAMYGLGSLIGPGLSGAGMDLWDPHGMMVAFGGMCAIYAALVAWRSITRPRTSGPKDGVA
jgi:MFS family permease